MDIKTIIDNKRQKKELSKDEIIHFISKYNKGEITDIQAAALITLLYTNGITDNEMIEITKAISETGEMINLSDISEDIVDIHSIGGIDDKVSIIVICALSSIGIPTAKVAVRQLALCDKLKSIPGYSINIGLQQFKEIVKEHDISIISEPDNLAPVENKIYDIRRLVNCMDNLTLMAIGIMGIKVALGANNIIFDISVGNGTYIKTKDEAKKISKLFIQIGKYFNKNIKCIITDSNEPIGYSFGNVSEIIEVVKALKGEMSEDVKEMVLEISEKYLSLLSLGEGKEKNRALILESLTSGKAYKKFTELVSVHGGDVGTLEKLDEIYKTKITIPVLSVLDGYVEKIDIDIVRSISMFLDAVRVKTEDKIDIGAGIVLNKKIGDKVEVGEVLAYINTNNEAKINGAVENLKNAFIITNKKVERKSKIIDIIE